ncbi:MAG TPA: MotA/TolQ/ExbB proton channel family protein [Thermoanaerobaculia bacterium]|nr:MotA/TolQ/ExbB proton channel family protein [Thermoanaerobaculia bacterium]
MDFGPVALWQSMGLIAKGVCIILAILSIYSLAVSVERLIVYAKAKKQSLQFAKIVTEHLKQDRGPAAIDAAKKFPASHLARVVSAGLLSYQFEKDRLKDGEDVIDAANRAIERATLLTSAEFRRGVGSLATIATTAPFIGLFGTVVGIINAFRGMAATGSGGIGSVSAGIAEALVTTAIGLFVAIPAAWMFNIFTNRLERFNVEMSNSSSELLDFFIRQDRSRKQG